MLPYLIAFLVTLCSFSGALLLIRKKIILKFLHYFVAYASGVFIGLAFFHILPEIIETGKSFYSNLILLGFVFFALIEIFLHWHHHFHKHTIGILNLIGDSLHNFLDGLFLSFAFKQSFELGIVAGLSIIFHEIPQEIADFSLLLYSGFSVKKALILNFLVACSIFLGVLLREFLTFNPLIFISFMLGNYLYLATVDLFPEIVKRKTKAFIAFLLGLLVAKVI